MDVITLLLVYFVSVNLIGFAFMGIDKYKAKKTLLGMYAFRHKTRHRSFVYGMPFILLVQLALLIAFLNAPIEISII